MSLSITCVAPSDNTEIPKGFERNRLPVITGAADSCTAIAACSLSANVLAVITGAAVPNTTIPAVAFAEITLSVMRGAASSPIWIPKSFRCTDEFTTSPDAVPKKHIPQMLFSLISTSSIRGCNAPLTAIPAPALFVMTVEVTTLRGFSEGSDCVPPNVSSVRTSPFPAPPWSSARPPARCTSRRSTGRLKDSTTDAAAVPTCSTRRSRMIKSP